MSPQKVQIGKISVAKVACGGHHSVFLDMNGQIHTCGNNSYGQLGHKSSQNLSVPQLVHNLSSKRIEQIACGWNHTLVWVPPYFVYSTGLGKYGELGLKNFEMRKGFMLIESLLGKNVIQIFAGGYHSWFLMDIECPDVDYEHPSPLIMTPALSINDDESSKKRLRSQDSNISRKRRHTPENRRGLNDLRTFNIKSDDDFKKYEDLFKELKMGFGNETRSEAHDGTQSKKRYFDLCDRSSDINEHSRRTVGVGAVKNVNLRNEFGCRISVNNDYNNNKSLPMTPRAKMHQNVDKDPELIIPGYLSISSSDDDSNMLSPNQTHRDMNQSADSSFKLENIDQNNKRSLLAKAKESRDYKTSQGNNLAEKNQNELNLESSEFRLKQSSNDELYANLLMLKKQGGAEKNQLVHQTSDSIKHVNKPISFLNDSRKNSSNPGNNTLRSLRNNIELSEDSDISADIKIENLDFDDEENESPKPREKSHNFFNKQADQQRRLKDNSSRQQSDRYVSEINDKNVHLINNKLTPEPVLNEGNSMHLNSAGSLPQNNQPSLPVVDSDNIEILDAANRGHLFRGSFGLNVNAPDNFFKQINKELEAEDQANDINDQSNLISETNEHYQEESEIQQNGPESKGSLFYERPVSDEGNHSLSQSPQIAPQNFRRDINKQDFNLIFTDLKYFHRFVIIYCDEKDNALIKSLTNQTIDYLRENDPQITVMDFLGSEEFCSIQSKQNYLQSFRIERIKGINSLILLMLATADNYEKIQRQKTIPETDYGQFSCSKTAAGSMYKLSEKDVANDLRLKVLGRWYLTLKKNLAGRCSILKFYELRPQIYR